MSPWFSRVSEIIPSAASWSEQAASWEAGDGGWEPSGCMDINNVSNVEG